MRCQDVERMMLESEERELVREERLALEEHLETCPACAAFQSFRGELRNSLREASGPGLSAELSDRVRLLCHAELGSQARSDAGEATGRRSAGVPWPIWAALLILTGLTLCFLVPGLEEFGEGQKLTLGTVLVLLVIFQNALMLFFAPLVMRRGRLSQSHS